MRASSDTFQNIADNCSAFVPKKDMDTFTNKSNYDSDVSCTTCKHFTKSSDCDLDLMEKIAHDHDF